MISVTVMPASSDVLVEGPASAAVLTVHRTAAFLRAQAQWLGRGLAHSEDAFTVEVVMAAHDHSHDRWLAVITLVREVLGPQAAADVSDVYAHVGRVAAAICHQRIGLVSLDVAASARGVIADQLSAAVDRVVESLWVRAMSA